MKRFLRFYNKDKQFVKMINQTENGFELIILSDKLMNEILETIHYCELDNDVIDIVWQMKFKPDNYKQYKLCTFSAPMDNFHPSDKVNPLGKKFKVKCEETEYYTDSIMFKNRMTKKSKIMYKDMSLFIRQVKISELNFKSKENDL